MRRTIQGLMVAGVITASLVFAGPALAAKKTVCMSGCAFSSIQSAINAATPGATITIGTGTYVENVVVSKSLTLQGYGTGTVIMPAVSNPVCSPGSLCGGAASNIVLVQADNVTLEHLTLEGDNPGLTSGVVRGGKDIDARNGIITNHEAGTFNNLTVSKVRVSDVYLRGIYASSGGTFNFNHDVVENVQGEEASIAIFDFEGAGVISNDKVTAANDAISANWSKGTQFLNNKVTDSGSGIHTDNNGGSGGTADVIQGNKISACPVNGYGIFVFAPYVSATVSSNKITGCSVGIAAFGSQVSGQGPTFSGNKVDGTGATTTDPNGTYGAYLTTDLLGFAFGDLNATLTGNTIQHFGTGMFVTQSNPSPEQPAGGQATVSASNNSIQNDTAGAKGEPGTVVNAQNNWWGCKNGPNMGGKCESATGTVAFTPSLTARP
jgi:nitrous oxidase accessory protein NosD